MSMTPVDADAHRDELRLAESEVAILRQDRVGHRLAEQVGSVGVWWRGTVSSARHIWFRRSGESRVSPRSDSLAGSTGRLPARVQNACWYFVTCSCDAPKSQRVLHASSTAREGLLSKGSCTAGDCIAGDGTRSPAAEDEENTIGYLLQALGTYCRRCNTIGYLVKPMGTCDAGTPLELRTLRTPLASPPHLQEWVSG